jgi:hypothetical protein
VDGEWHHSPFNERYRGGYLTFPSEYFSNAASRRAHRNKIRYTIARWGYSPSIASWMICTETDWVEPYHNHRSLRCEEREAFRGWPPDYFPIPDQRELVREWLVDMAYVFKKTDAHPHVVSTQFSLKTEGLEMWQRDEMEVILHSCYTTEAYDTKWLGEHYVGSHGVADVLFVYGKRFESFDDRPVLLGEWGGSTEENHVSHLCAELHTGIWTQFMTNTAGTTGFWWWNVIDREQLYPHYRAISNFARGEDRRGRNYRSSRALVASTFPAQPKSGRTRPIATELPFRQAFVLSDETTLFAYVFHRELNQTRTSRPAESFSDPSFPETMSSHLRLPYDMTPGLYVVEYWDTFRGAVIERREVALTGQEDVIPLIAHRVDLALKAKLVAPY